MILPVLLTLLWSLAEVHSQTEFPYVSFRGETLPNHGYVVIDDVGRPDEHGGAGEGVQCHTDLATCCSGAQGMHRGDWYFPNGARLPFTAGDINTFEARTESRVELRHNRGTELPPEGIYRCNIATIAVHDDDDESVGEAVYIGVYARGRGGKFANFEMKYSAKK